jgi:hypothetical protein
MATDESFQATADPVGVTVTRKRDQENSEPFVADLAREKPVFVVQDSAGGFW